MDKLELLYDHYKETYSLSREAQCRRNKSFVILCILEAFLFLLSINPEKAFNIINAGINNELGVALQVSNTIVQTLLWILVAYIMIRYVQDVLYIERQYTYLKNLEREISGESKSTIFAREGENYSKKYPMVLNFIDLFYKVLMPIVFALINVVRIYREWMALDSVTVALICDTVLFASILVVDWFYFFEIHPKVTEFCKNHIPLVKTIAKHLRKILKEV